MKAILTNVCLDSVNTYNKEELEKLVMFFPTAKYKDFFDFKPYVSETDPEYDEKIEKAKKEFEEYKNSEYKQISGYSNSFLCDINILMTQLPKLKFSVKGTTEVNIEMENSSAIKLQQNSIQFMIDSHSEKLNSMMRSFLKMSENIAENLKIETLNQKCDVHIGGGLLMTVNDTLLLEDSCTNKLQQKLNNGWRILAVTVQPDGRRPDYVLGRYNPNINV